MAANQFLLGNQAFHVLSCIICLFASRAFCEETCSSLEIEADSRNAASLLQVHKPETAAQTQPDGNYLGKAADAVNAKLNLRRQLDKLVLEDAKLRRANKDLERKVVEEHSEIERLEVMVEKLYEDKVKKDSTKHEAEGKESDDRSQVPKREVQEAKTTQKEETAPGLRHEVQDDKAPQTQEIIDDGRAPCECEASGADWQKAAERKPRCIFIDLGAADGNTFSRFLSNGYGDIANCPSHGSYEAILVEANPVFNKPLQALEKNFSGLVRSASSTAAYMCEGKTSFYLDTVDVETHYWGSSMSPNARDVQRSGKKKVTVPLLNLNRLLWETAIKDDYVLVKMDIEGSEHDILPCLAKSEAAELVDALYVEQHPVEWSRTGAQEGALQKALALFQQRGVTTPEYDSPM